ncbi:polysaccharide pyruvyl transferase family protein [Microbacterium caowuchunii]|uniref:polysaccharide pyruvyl transferase family protein n=1 Tax=Microbacterium caowuchunii TaxID=2614638 RepID=UPI00124819DF|nr:polysaccharide pyruvyl transferase family protein [Microbacterium caowuchunii]QEV99026.1 polysaccharide pyruvyl transferase family protein [Microbacterium caowuchunii]
MRLWTDPPHRSPRPTRTFVSLTGPPSNIGDALIRRAQLEWARGTSDELVVYVGDAPDAWLAQVGAPEDATVLRSKQSVRRWLWMLATSPRRPVLVFEAGEVPLDRGNTLRELVFLAETLMVRLKRGVVVRPPRGIRAPTNPAVWLHARAAQLSQFALWRDAASARTVGGNRIVPDIGFAAGVRPGNPWEDRDELIVSLRGTRPHPGTVWIDAIRTTAEAEGLRIRTVVQVREDEERARKLAEQLGGVFEAWGDTDAVVQEEQLRERYAGARLVISDRMHVLILAALSGAVPVELVPHPTRKIAEAFATVGLRDISVDAASHDANSMVGLLRTQLGRAAEVRLRVRQAEQRLAATEAEVRATIKAARA